MDPATMAMIGGIGSDVLGGLLGSSAQKKANRANIRLQRENNAWMERMSNTQWQRGTQDMLAAGLNPMLAYSQGGASTPSSSAATVNPVDALGRSVTSAGSKAMQAVSMQQALAQIDLTKASTTKTLEEARSAKSASEIARFNSGMVGETWDLNANEQRQRTKLLEAQIAQAAKQGDLTNEQARQIRSMLPMLIQASQVDTQLKRLQVPTAKAESEFWAKAGDEGKLMQFLKQLLK